MHRYRHPLSCAILLLACSVSGTCVEAPVSVPPVPAPRPVGAGHEYDGVALTQEVATAAAILPATLHIDPQRVLRPVSRDLLGVTLGGRETESILFAGGEALSADANAMLPQLPLHLVRISQYNHPHGQEVAWKQAVGPVSQRPAVQFNTWDRKVPNRVGPSEIIAAMCKANPQVRFVWTVDIEHPDTHDAADLAEYLTWSDGNPRGGTNWAELRRADGLAQPVPIVLWELGNETDWRQSEVRLDAAAYVERCRHAIAAIRSVQPRAQFAAHVATAPWAWQDRFKEDWRSFHRTVLRTLGPDIDFLAFHPYYFGYPTSVIESYMDAIREDVLSITGSDRIKLYISEHGLWPGAAEGQPWETSWWRTHGLPGCLATSQFLNRVATRTDVGPATYHCLSSGPWGVVYRDRNSGRLWGTGIRDLFALYRDYLGDEVLAATLGGDQTDPSREDCSLTVLATRRPDGVALIATNRADARRPLRLDGWQVVSGAVLSGDRAEARNSQDRQEIHITPWVPAAAIELPVRSVTAFHLKRR